MNTEPVDITDFKQAYRTRNEGDFPDKLWLCLQKENDLKYGENPNQHAAMYIFNLINGSPVPLEDIIKLSSVRSDEHGKGGLSQTNMMDISRAVYALGFFKEPAVAIMKHNIVSGFAKAYDEDWLSFQKLDEKNRSLVDLFRLARDSDRRSNFGGTAVFNEPLDMETARALFELKGESPFFVDVLAAPGYDEGVLGYVESQSKNMRIAEFSGSVRIPRFMGDDTHGFYSLKEMPGGRIAVQDLFLTRIISPDDLVLRPMVVDKSGRHVINYLPTERQTDDMITAWYLNVAGARSNGVVFVKDGVLVSMGSGQVERVGAVEQAIIKGMQKAMDRQGLRYDPLMGITGYERLENNPFKGAACSSDAFFPFPDSIELLDRVGVSAVLQPYGSVMDGKVIDAANAYGIAMPFTGERCFGHF